VARKGRADCAVAYLFSPILLFNHFHSRRHVARNASREALSAHLKYSKKYVRELIPVPTAVRAQLSTGFPILNKATPMPAAYDDGREINLTKNQTNQLGKTTADRTGDFKAVCKWYATVQKRYT
jgi:hypothetical protein